MAGIKRKQNREQKKIKRMGKKKKWEGEDLFYCFRKGGDLRPFLSPYEMDKKKNRPKNEIRFPFQNREQRNTPTNRLDLWWDSDAKNPSNFSIYTTVMDLSLSIYMHEISNCNPVQSNWA